MKCLQIRRIGVRGGGKGGKHRRIREGREFCFMIGPGAVGAGVFALLFPGGVVTDVAGGLIPKGLSDGLDEGTLGGVFANHAGPGKGVEDGPMSPGEREEREEEGETAESAEHEGGNF